jgi:hypothetical protein
MNLVGGLVILGLGLPVLAAIVIPVVLASRRPATEARVAAVLRDYARAQARFRQNDWDSDGVLEYANPYTLLRTQTFAGGPPAGLIDAEFAAARGRNGTPRHGYLFREMKTIGGRKIDWAKQFALCAVPRDYCRATCRTLIISAKGKVYALDRGSNEFLDDYPRKPSAEGWESVE